MLGSFARDRETGALLNLLLSPWLCFSCLQCWIVPRSFLEWIRLSSRFPVSWEWWVLQQWPEWSSVWPESAGELVLHSACKSLNLKLYKWRTQHSVARPYTCRKLSFLHITYVVIIIAEEDDKETGLEGTSLLFQGYVASVRARIRFRVPCIQSLCSSISQASSEHF